MKTGSPNKNLQELIRSLKEQSLSQKVNLWKRIATDLEKPSRKRRIVNLSRISRNTKQGEVIIVPGKVLGDGAIEHALEVAALNFSGSAKEQIEKAKGKCLTISELLKKNPKGQKVRIIG